MTSNLSTPGQAEDAGGQFLVNRRDFVRTCVVAAAAVGLAGSSVEKVIAAVSKGLKPSVIWLHFQECTGCTMTLLRPSHPGLDELILPGRLVGAEFVDVALARLHIGVDVLG